MKTLTFDNRDAWLEARRGKITGSTVKDIVSTGGPTKEAIASVLEARNADFKKADKKEVLEGLLTLEEKAQLTAQLPKKIGFYRLIAERLGLPPDDTDPMERGQQLEAEAMARFTKETGKELDTTLRIWTREDDDSVAVSPDASVVGEESAVEGKCLGSTYHIKAWVEQRVPDEYWFQVLQYFIVNDKLQTLYFVFYDPRIPAKDFFMLTVKREEVQADVDMYLAYQKAELAQVRDIVSKLTF